MVTSVSIQYAKALFDLAVEQKLEQIYLEYLDVFSQVLTANPDIYRTFTHPRVSNQEKKQVIKTVFAERVDQTFLSFVYVLIDNERLEDMPNILVAYQNQLYAYQNQMVVDVYTKYSFTAAEQRKMIQTLEGYFHKQIILREHIDQSLIAGIRLIAKGQILDANIHQRLADLRSNLKKGW